jgi:hypothetical protein
LLTDIDKYLHLLKVKAGWVYLRVLINVRAFALLFADWAKQIPSGCRNRFIQLYQSFFYIVLLSNDNL